MRSTFASGDTWTVTQYWIIVSAPTLLCVESLAISGKRGAKTCSTSSVWNLAHTSSSMQRVREEGGGKRERERLNIRTDRPRNVQSLP